MDYEELRLKSHDQKEAMVIKRAHQEVILKESLIGNTAAAKVLANLMYHFEDVREESKSHFEDYIKLCNKDGFTYGRIVFWITSVLGKEKEPKQSLKLQRLLISAISKAANAEARGELMRSLCNLGVIKDPVISDALLEDMRRRWLDSDIETLFILESVKLDSKDARSIVKTMECSTDLVQILRSLGCALSFEENRKIFRNLILPSKNSLSEQNNKVKRKLEELLQSNHMEQVIAAGDFCMALVGSKPARLVYHFGYGRIAGYLYMSGINLQKDRLEVTADSSDEEDLRSLKGSELDLISGDFKDSNDSRLLDMTEEEKEAEAEKLMGLLKKLEATGVVKVIPK